MPIITLTTDFGDKDGFVGTMKGVIWGICPDARIADISHQISAQNVMEAAIALWRAFTFFPAGTVHVAVVDPGVGTHRRPIAVRAGAHFFVGPDNGLFTPIFEEAERSGWPLEVVELTAERYWLPAISRTFHGRDIFSPVGAHLAAGVPLADLGPVITDALRIQMPRPQRTSTGWRAHVTVVDVFGNLTTDLPAEVLPAAGQVSFLLRGREVNDVVDSYGHRQPGDLVALVDSENFIEIAVVNGSAAAMLGARVGDVVEVIIQ